MDRYLNLNLLISFVTLIEEDGVGRAARKLGVSQPALSNQLKLLEDSLDCVLLDRAIPGIHLTAPGETVLQYARSVVFIREKIREQVRIGVSNKVQATMLLNILGRDSLPKKVLNHARITVLVDDDRELFKRLQTSSLDMILSSQPLELADSIECAGTINLPVHLVVPTNLFDAEMKQNPHKASTDVVDQVLAGNIPFLLPTSGLRLRAEIDEFLRTRKANPPLLLESDVMGVLSLGMLHQFGASFLSAQYIPYDLSHKMKVLGPAGGLWQHTMWLYTRRELCYLPFFQMIRDALISNVAP
jgi:DNA-binding transcriptional LysR family regulator